jgi:glycosyltransferase involved in cell wall biosynthesis
MDQTLLILLYIFIAVVIIQITYYLLIFGKFSFKKFPKHEPKNIPISILVCAKNEEDNIEQLVDTLLAQNYPKYEIVLIDDASSDGTLEIFEQLEKKHTNIKVIKVKNNEAFWGNKKFALTLGIKASAYENLVFIDADCYPVSENWLREMSAQFNEEKSIVLGYGAYEKKDNSFLNKIIRFETLLTAIQYFSWAIFGKPYMGVGRNLAYKKSEFYNANGFINHMKIRSGDDDLFINQVANKQNTSITCSMDSFTFSKPKNTFKDWIDQKRRHISTAQYYKSFDKIQLAVFYISQILFLVLSAILLSFLFQWIIVLSLFILRYIISWIVIHNSAKKLDEEDIVIYYPIYDIILTFTQLYLFLRNLSSKKPVQWK